MALVTSPAATVRAIDNASIVATPLAGGQADLNLVRSSDALSAALSLAEPEAAPPSSRHGRRHCGGQRFESPPLHQVVAANRPGFPAPTIPRLFSALARKLMVCAACPGRPHGIGRLRGAKEVRRILSARFHRPGGETELGVPAGASPRHAARGSRIWRRGGSEAPAA
jgi:hypothetical protein